MQLAFSVLAGIGLWFIGATATMSVRSWMVGGAMRRHAGGYLALAIGTSVVVAAVSFQFFTFGNGQLTAVDVFSDGMALAIGVLTGMFFAGAIKSEMKGELDGLDPDTRRAFHQAFKSVELDPPHPAKEHGEGR